MLWDIYVLAKAREKKYVQAFLNTWAKDFEEVADEYLLPQYSEESEKTFTEANLLMNCLFKNHSNRIQFIGEILKGRQF
jgi:hypothetical protein